MVQFQEVGKIVVCNLDCHRISGAHTAENIKPWFNEIKSQFEIEEKQLLVFAINSAANIQKAAQEYLEEPGETFSVDLMSMTKGIDDNNETCILKSIIPTWKKKLSYTI